MRGGSGGRPKKLSIFQSVLIPKSDLSEWTRIRRCLPGLGGSRRSNSALENRTASTEHFSSQISGLDEGGVRRQAKKVEYFSIRIDS